MSATYLRIATFQGSNTARIIACARAAFVTGKRARSRTKGQNVNPVPNKEKPLVVEGRLLVVPVVAYLLSGRRATEIRQRSTLTLVRVFLIAIAARGAQDMAIR